MATNLPARWELDAAFPDSPTEVWAYWSLPVVPGLDASRANAVATRLGVEASGRSYVGEGGDSAFSFEGQDTQLTVFSDEPLSFAYAQNPVKPWPTETLPFESRAKIIEGFLESRGLLDNGYRVEAYRREDALNATVAITQLIDNIPLFETNPGQPRIWGSVDAEGNVNQVFYQVLRLQKLESVQLISAEQAWHDLLSGGEAKVLGYLKWDAVSLDRVLALQDWPEPITTHVSPGKVTDVVLTYLAPDTSQMSLNALPADSRQRLVLPCWAFSGRLGDSQTFTVLVQASLAADTLQVPK